MAYTTINKPSDYFNTILYTGDNSSPRTITGVGFQPDMNWSKIRSESNDHWVSDAVRGANKIIRPNGTDDELVNGSGGYISSFNSDGYVIASGSANNNNFNKSSGTMVSWNWKANGAGVSNTDGDITSTVSANTTSGFSIVSYTGTGSEATIGHGLGVTPKIVFFKRLDSTTNWVVQTPILGNRVQLVLNDTSTSNTDSRLGASDNWSNSVFTVGTYGDMNASGGTYIAYCFAEKTGYSKFGSYTGAGSNFPFIYTGFKPAFVMFKNTSSALFWQIHDSARDPFNEVQKRLAANSSDAEGSGSIPIDFLSNGIKLRTTATTWNESGSNFIYMAFAEEPLVGDNPATAR